MDVDTEMADNTQDTTANGSSEAAPAPAPAPRNNAPNEASSGTLDHDFTQSETQPAETTTSGLSHHNRKDVTLREFLSKMDDYAPIVRLAFHCPLAYGNLLRHSRRKGHHC